MRSLRSQLLVGTALGTTAVLLVSGAVLYALISGALWAEFDESLASKARSLAALAEQEGDRLDFEPDEAPLPEFEPSDRAELYQVWLPDGTVLSRSPSLLGADLERIAGPSEAPAFKTGQLPDGRPGRLVGLTFVPRQANDEGGPNSPITVTLVVGRGIGGLQATLARVRGILIAVSLAAVALSAGALAWVVRRGLRPIDRLGNQIADVGAGDLSARIDAAGVPRELSPVVDRLNDLLARLDAAFQRERRFTGDVAHELRNPLAGVRSKLELALSRERRPEAYREALGDCLDINLQMQRMVENLLHLARGDAGQLELRPETVDLSELVRECWEPLEGKARARGLSVGWCLDHLAQVEADRDKLRLVLQNILDNAVTYTNDGGSISLSTAPEDGIVELTVSNTGSRLPPDDVVHVFDRFWRGDASQRASDGHCGLGLSLCKTLVGRLGGSIEAGATVDGTFTIKIRLPAAARCHPRPQPNQGA